MTVPLWLAGIIGGALITALLTLVQLVVSNSETNVKQNEKIAQIERQQEIARGIVGRVDAADQSVQAQVAQLRERLATLEAGTDRRR